MTRLKSIITSSILTLVLCLAILTTALVMNDAQAVQANASDQPVVTNLDGSIYLQLTDAPPQRDIALQQFASLQ